LRDVARLPCFRVLAIHARHMFRRGCGSSDLTARPYSSRCSS
jgi:hypothetical protein